MNDPTTNNNVQLGCGTLIVIALIVIIFSGGSDVDKLQESVDELQVKIDRLEVKIDELSKRSDAPPSLPAERAP